MNQQQLRLTQLLGSKELTFGCKVIASSGLPETIDGHYSLRNKTLYTKRFCDGCPEAEAMPILEIIGHPATLTDFHKWLNEKHIPYRQYGNEHVDGDAIWILDLLPIPYDSSKDLLDQSTETLAQIIELITNNSNPC